MFALKPNQKIQTESGVQAAIMEGRNPILFMKLFLPFTLEILREYLLIPFRPHSRLRILRFYFIGDVHKSPSHRGGPVHSRILFPFLHELKDRRVQFNSRLLFLRCNEVPTFFVSSVQDVRHLFSYFLKLTHKFHCLCSLSLYTFWCIHFPWIRYWHGCGWGGIRHLYIPHLHQRISAVTFRYNSGFRHLHYTLLDSIFRESIIRDVPSAHFGCSSRYISASMDGNGGDSSR